MKKFLPLILSLLFALTLSAQVVQKGIAVEYNEKAAKTALAGVEFRVQRAGSTASDAKGAFVLDFPTLKAGDRVAVRRIEKPGYEIFNKEAVEQWNINPSRAFTVVMCRSDKFKALKDRYYSNSEERYAGQYRSAKAELERLKKEGKLKEQEYFARLREVEAEYEKKLDNLDNYVDRFARIDLSELNAEEQAIIDLVQAGQIDEAIARYEKMNYLGKALKEISDIKEIEEAVNSLNELHEGKTADRDAYLAGVERTINTMLLAGDSKNNATIAEMYTTIADADTTNIDWLSKTGAFLRDYIADYQGALAYFKKAKASGENSSTKDSFDYASSIINIGVIYGDLGDEAEALRCYEEALPVLKKVLGENDHKIALLLNNIGNSYSKLGYFQRALEYYSPSLEILTDEDPRDIQTLVSTYNNKGAALIYSGDIFLALNDLTTALLLCDEYLGDNSLEKSTTCIHLGMVYGNIGMFDKALECFMTSINIFKQVLGEDHPRLAIAYHNVGNTYRNLGIFEQALSYHNKALNLRVKAFGMEHPEVAYSLDGLGRVYKDMEQYQIALNKFEGALEIKKKIYGEGHLALTELYEEIGETLMEMEEYQKSIDNYQASIDIYRNFNGSENVEIANNEFFVACNYYYMGNYPVALEYFEKAYSVLEKALGSDSEQCVVIKDNIDAVKNKINSKK